MAESGKHEAALQRALAAGDNDAAAIIRARIHAENPLAGHYSALHKARAAGDAEAVGAIEGRIREDVAKSRDADGLEGSTTSERFFAGAGAGMRNIENNVRDLVGGVPGLGVIRPDAERFADDKETRRLLNTTAAGNIGGMVGETAMTLPIGGIAAAGAKSVAGKVLTRAAPAIANGLASPMGMALTDGLAQAASMADPGGRLATMTTASGLLAGLGAGGKLLQKAYRGLVKPSASAEYLRSQGVEGLTVGQMAPDSVFAQLEQAGTSTPAIGNTLKAQRAAGDQSWQRAVVRKAPPPGTVLDDAHPDEMLAQTYDAFKEAYAPIRATPVPASFEGRPLRDMVRDVFGQIASDSSVLAGEAERKAMSKFLQNEASILDKVGAAPALTAAGRTGGGATNAQRLAAANGPQARLSLPPAAGLARTGGDALGPVGGNAARSGADAAKGAAQEFMTAEPLMTIRSNIRKKWRQQMRGQNPNYTNAEFLEKAEEALTSAIEYQLPQAQREALRAIDRQYARSKIVENAVGAAGDAPGGFTPTLLSRAVKSATEKGSYARGAGGDLRQMAAAGREALDTTVPLTGARMITGIWPLNYVTGAGAAAANSPAIKRVLLGETAPQMAAKMTDEALRRSALLNALRRGSSNEAARLGEGHPLE